MARAKTIDCEKCGGAMARHKFSEGNWKILVGLVLLVGGIALAVAIPVVGWIVGLLMIIIGLAMGGKRRQGWRCQQCGYFFDAR